jgi:hypothetical protein
MFPQEFLTLLQEKGTSPDVKYLSLVKDSFSKYCDWLLSNLQRMNI